MHTDTQFSNDHHQSDAAVVHFMDPGPQSTRDSIYPCLHFKNIATTIISFQIKRYLMT